MSPSPCLSVVWAGMEPVVASRWRTSIAKSTARSVEALELDSEGSAGRRRNAAASRACGRYLVFLSATEPCVTSFFELAVRALERDPNLAFVASWHLGLPTALDRPLQPLESAALLGRPWFVHVPSVFRRELVASLSGFDEGLSGLEDLDFWLRALAAGKRGGAIEAPGLAGEPLPPSARRTDAGARDVARVLFERHRELFEANAAEIVLGKERVVQELFGATRTVDLAAHGLRREALRLTRLLERVEPG